MAREDLPPASDFPVRAVRLAADGAFLTGVLATLRAAAAGLLLAALVAVPLGILLGGVPRLDAALPGAAPSVLAGLLGLAVNTALVGTERRLFPWRSGRAEGAR